MKARLRVHAAAPGATPSRAPAVSRVPRLRRSGGPRPSLLFLSAEGAPRRGGAARRAAVGGSLSMGRVAASRRAVGGALRPRERPLPAPAARGGDEGVDPSASRRGPRRIRRLRTAPRPLARAGGRRRPRFRARRNDRVARRVSGGALSPLDPSVVRRLRLRPREGAGEARDGDGGRRGGSHPHRDAARIRVLRGVRRDRGLLLGAWRRRDVATSGAPAGSPRGERASRRRPRRDLAPSGGRDGRAQHPVAGGRHGPRSRGDEAARRCRAFPSFVVDGVVADWTVVGVRPGRPGLSVSPLPDARAVSRGSSSSPGSSERVRDGSRRRCSRCSELFSRSAMRRRSSASRRACCRLSAGSAIPERHLILAGFGLAWLAALGLSRLALAISPRALRIVLPLLALAVLLDREGIARRLSPLEDASVLTRAPASPRGAARGLRRRAAPASLLQRCLPARSGVRHARHRGREPGRARNAPSRVRVALRRRLSVRGRLRPVAFGRRRSSGRASCRAPCRRRRRSLCVSFGASASRRSSGASAGTDGRYRPHLERIADPVPPYRFATHARRVRRRARGLRAASRGRLLRRHRVRRRGAAGRLPPRPRRAGSSPWPTGRRDSSSTSRSTARVRASSCSTACGRPRKRRRSTAVRFRVSRRRVRVRGPSGASGTPCFAIAARHALGEDRRR